VLVLDSPETIRKKFKTAVTDSGREVRYAPEEQPGVSNLVEILSVSTGRTLAEVERAYDGRGYGDLKSDVGEAVVELFAPVQARYAELRADEGELRRLLRVGAEKARETSAPTLQKMYERMGFVAP
jgi:tryptophanyl-tRNA synthetase